MLHESTCTNMSAASQQVLREQKGGEMFSLQAAETDPTAQGK